MSEKLTAKEYAEKLLYTPEYAADKQADVKEKAAAFAEGYKKFMDSAKTEREAAVVSEQMLLAAGYKAFEPKKAYAPGEKVYFIQENKAVVAATIGQKPYEEGFRLVIAHTDCPRLDLRPNPLYESDHMSYFRTHYYGGVRKYQWATIPLAIHGVFTRADGSSVNFAIGEDENDPVVSVTDLLPHLAADQMKKQASTVIEGEKLDVLIGSRPLAESKTEGEKGKKEKEAVKAGILKLLKEKYDMDEEDFLSAELEIVPAGKARETGLDRSMIMSYGQDDRVCAFTSLKAILDVENVERTACCILVDKEEIGSVGATGMESKFFENTVAELLDRLGAYSGLALRRTLANSKMLSSDVNAAYDPLYAEAYEKRNSSMAGCGMVFNKFTGARGKSGSNDANAEYIAKIRRIMDEAGVKFQLAELGKVDVGGGGTIAYILALYGMDVIDCGVAVLNMHAPWEITSKADVYETKRGYEVFLRNMK